MLKALVLMPLLDRVGSTALQTEDIPEGVRAIIASTLQQSPASLNTDWFGTTLLQGLLELHARGITDARTFASSWFDHHLRSGKLSPYTGAKSREVVAGGIHITTYAGHFGLAFPCYELAVQFGSPEARQACIEVGWTILHQTARNRLGMVEHDDGGEFAIPDTCYFVVRALMSAYALAPGKGQAFLEQAVYQLRIYVDTFLSAETGLARTVLFRQGLGQTCWTRASGWLLWAITAVLRFLPRDHPASAYCLASLRSLTNGMEQVQQSSGGFRVLLNDPETPVETTGTAMFASGIHEAVRKGWLPRPHLVAARHAWEFVKERIAANGEVTAAYSGWALPAEQHLMSMDEHRMGWIPGFVLLVANEMTQPI